MKRPILIVQDELTPKGPIGFASEFGQFVASIYKTEVQAMSLRFAKDNLRDMVGAIIDFENVPIECVRDMWRLAEDHFRLTDPAPFDEQKLQEVGFKDRDGVKHRIYRGKICVWVEGGEIFGWSVADGESWSLVNPQPQCMGDAWTLIERVERENANA